MEKHRNGTGRAINRERRAHRRLEELNVIDDFILSAAASDMEGGENFCKELISVLLGYPIGKVKVNAQKFIPASTPQMRGIRMDVEVLETAEPVLNLYDIEPCKYKKKGIEKGNRFYQAKIDSRYLSGGEMDFQSLPNLFVLTILTYDPFGYDFMAYHIRNRCVEVPDLDYQDGLEYIYYYTKGTKGGSPEIKALLKYLEESTEENATGEVLKGLHSHIQKVKMQPEVREEFMRWDEMIYYERQEAAEKASEEARRTQQLQDIFELLKDYGEISEKLQEELRAEKDPEKLSFWLKLAARSGSMEAFLAGYNTCQGETP